MAEGQWRHRETGGIEINYDYNIETLISGDLSFYLRRQQND